MYTHDHARLAREAGDEAGAKKIEERIKRSEKETPSPQPDSKQPG